MRYERESGSSNAAGRGRRRRFSRRTRYSTWSGCEPMATFRRPAAMGFLSLPTNPGRPLTGTATRPRPHHVPVGSAVCGAFLDHPGVAIGVGEEDEGIPVLAPALEADALLKVHHFADVHASLGQLGPGSVDVGDDELEAIQPRLAEFQLDGTAGPGRGELHDALVVAYPKVEVEIETDLLGVELPRTVDVRDAYRHNLEIPLHGAVVPSALDRYG